MKLAASYAGIAQLVEQSAHNRSVPGSSPRTGTTPLFGGVLFFERRIDMSGGRFPYLDSSLKSEIFGRTDKPRNVFEDREISELVWDVLNLIHEFDWYVSGDTGKESYLACKAEFKKKWLDNRGIRVRRIVDEAIQECKAELYETYGVLTYGKTEAILERLEAKHCPNCGAKMDMGRAYEQ